VDKGATAQAMASSINGQTANTGVSATARTDMQMTFNKAGSYSIQLQSDNGSPQTVSFSVTDPGTADGLAGAIAAINDQSSKTGVVAAMSKDNTGIVLTNATGNDIMLGAAPGSASLAGEVTVQKMTTNAAGDLAAMGTGVQLGGAVQSKEEGKKTEEGEKPETNDLVVVSGYLTMDSSKSFSAVAADTNVFSSSNSSLKKVSELDVTTVTKATDALKTVDSALAFINGERAKLGALQSRFDTAISNLQVASENMSASRSRIQDADFASETSNLSRAQILQQAGTAMVAQANQLPQGVLALLR
jgi:flagellin